MRQWTGHCACTHRAGRLGPRQWSAAYAILPFVAIVQHPLDRLPAGHVDAPVPRLAVGGGCRRRSSSEGDRFVAERGAQAQPPDDCCAMTTALADPPSHCRGAPVTDTKKPRHHKRATDVGAVLPKQVARGMKGPTGLSAIAPRGYG